MKQFPKRLMSWLLILAMCLSLLPGIALAAQVDYQTGTATYESTSFQNVIKNWGTRGTTATFLSPNAESYYTANGVSYSSLAALSGDALYTALENLMTSTHTNQVTYDDTRALYSFTDCQGNDTNNLTCFYSGSSIGPAWDAGATWNREHTWPQSKGMKDDSEADEADIVMIRPASSSINSSRGNKAYGESDGYFDPNTVSNGTLNLRGDVARSVLYGYVRWDNTSYMWGTDGVIESADVLLRWIQEDPVDTWEMGRNDSVESVTGVRNVFIDYPELAYALLGAEVPADLTTPSGATSDTGSGEGGYVLVTDVDDVTDGGQFVIVAQTSTGAYMAVPTTLTSGKFVGTEVTVSGNTVTGTELPVWTVEAVDGGIALSADGSYLAYNSSTNFKMATDAYTWTVSDTFVINSSVTTRGIYFQESSSKFGAYSTQNANASGYVSTLQLYKFTEGGETPDAPAACEHSYTAQTVAATCLEDGLTTYTCALCGDSYTETIPATGHTMVDGTCSVCGFTAVQLSGNFYIAAKRSSGNYFYMTSDLGTASTKRYTAVDSGLAELPAAIDTGMPDRTFTLTANSDGTYMINVAGTEDYLGWTSGNSGALVAADAALALTVTEADGVYTIVADAAEGRNLSLNSSNPYFAFYAGTQINDLYLIPVTAIGAACEHTNTTVENAADATCTDNGYTGDTFCADCGELIAEGEEIAALGHSNNDGDNYCDVCGTQVSSDTLYTKATSIAIGNTVLLVNEAASMELSGISTTSTKYGIGSAYTDVPVGLMPLTVVAGANEGTFAFQTADGNYLYWTSGNSLNVNATLSDKTSWNVTFDADGNASITNANTSARKIFWNNSNPRFACYTTTSQAAVQLYKLGGGETVECKHEVTNLVDDKAATCTEEGYTGDTVCASCGEVIATGETIPAAGHSYVDGICTVCGDLDPNFTISDTGFVRVTDASQITAGGKFVIVVNNEGVNLAMPIEIDSGKFVGQEVTVNGRIVTGENIPYWTIEAVEGGIAISTQGSYLNYGSSTNFKLNDTPYTWALSDGFVIASADAETTRGLYFQIESGKFGAYANSNATASGYISNLQLYKYQVGTQGCSHVYLESVTDATCTEDGLKTFTCDLCGDSYTETIPATGHSHEAVVTEPTCTEGGYTTYTCACGDSYVSDEVPANGHSYVDGTCTVCGEADPDYVVKPSAYYLVGYINGADYGCQDDAENMGDYKFVDGTLVVTFTDTSYVFLKGEGNVDWYMTNAYCEDTTATFYSTSTGAAEKMLVPGGVEITFTLVENEDGSLTMSYTTPAPEPSVVPTLKQEFPTLTFEDMISMNVYVSAQNADDIVEMGLMMFDSKLTEFTIADAARVVPGYSWSSTYNMYVVSTGAIAAKDMSDTVNFATYAKLADGTYAYTPIVSYSPTNYAYSLLNNGDQATKNLMVAMLNYGAEAQTFFSYRTDALMNARLTDEQKASIETYRADMMAAVSGVDAAKAANFTRTASGFTSRYPSISFEGAFKINYYCTPSAVPAGDITLYYWNQADFDAADVLTVDNATDAIVMTENAGNYETAITGIAAKDLDKGVYVAFVYSDGTNTYCSGILGYSIGAYCVSNAATTAPIAPFAAATAVYGYYAKQMFGN